MSKSSKYSVTKEYILIILFLFFTLFFVSCSDDIEKKYNSVDDYKKVIYEFAENYGYDITDEKISLASYEVSLTSDDIILFQFDIGKKSQYNRFNIICENVVLYDEIITFVNELSRKEFKENQYYDLIQDNRKYTGVEDSDINYYSENYDFYKIKYLGISEDYCLEYYSYSDSDENVLTFAGFTR